MKKVTCDTMNFNELYFDCETEEICNYIQNHYRDFEFSDPASIAFSFCNDMIYIEGDEDYHELTIETIIPIKTA